MALVGLASLLGNLKYSVSILDSKTEGVLLLDRSCNQSITICMLPAPPPVTHPGGGGGASY